MPEGDAVFLTARRLHDALAGKTVTRFDLRVPTLALADQRGRTVTEVRPYAKHILMRFDDERTLHSHLRMDGAWRVGPANQPPRGGPAHAIRALVGNDDEVAAGLRVHDLALIDTSEEHTLIGHLGPDLLDPDFDRDEAIRRLTHPDDRPIAVSLLDQRIVGGLGTIWRSELLWLHRISPYVTVQDAIGSGVSPAGLVNDAARLLTESVARQLKPRPRDPFLARQGELEVYDRIGRPCRRCGTAIKADQLGDPGLERIVYFCPTCQSG